MEYEDNFKIGDQDFGECSMLSVHATYVSIRATCKMSASEKLCLQWNDFKDNVSSSFGELREDKDLIDVTLACEDGKQVEAHKVVLAASSPFFKDILKRNKHPHPLIYMRGLTYR